MINKIFEDFFDDIDNVDLKDTVSDELSVDTTEYEYSLHIEINNNSNINDAETLKHKFDMLINRVCYFLETFGFFDNYKIEGYHSTIDNKPYNLSDDNIPVGTEIYSVVKFKSNIKNYNTILNFFKVLFMKDYVSDDIKIVTVYMYKNGDYIMNSSKYTTRLAFINKKTQYLNRYFKSMVKEFLPDQYNLNKIDEFIKTSIRSSFKPTI